MSNVNSEVRDFIIENFLFGDTVQDLGDDISLIEAEIVDSTGILELVGFVEKTFEIEIADADIVPANFDSIGRISAFVDSRRITVAA